MDDGVILSTCLDSRDAYDRISSHVDKSEFSPMGAFWWELVADWYVRDDRCESVDRAVLRERGGRKAGEKRRQDLQSYFDGLSDSVSPDNIVSELLAVKRYAKHYELASADTTDLVRIRELVEQYRDLLDAEDLDNSTWIASGSWDEIDEQLDDANRLKLLPLALNQRAGGGAVPGQHIVLFGPTEIGKSLFTINMVCGFLRQGRRVLYVSNEDSANVVMERVRCNLSGMLPEEARENKDKALARARSKGLDLLSCGNMDPGNVAEIEKAVLEYDSDVVVIDQLRNLHAVGIRSNAGITQRMDQAAQEFRSMLLRHGLIGVSIVQAHAGEHGKRQVFFHADDVDSSRVGAPGAADLLLGIGADDEMIDQGTRAISICKNKLGKGRDPFIVQFDTLRSKCK